MSFPSHTNDLVGRWNMWHIFHKRMLKIVNATFPSPAPSPLPSVLYSTGTPSSPEH